MNHLEGLASALYANFGENPRAKHTCSGSSSADFPSSSSRFSKLVSAGEGIVILVAAIKGGSFTPHCKVLKRRMALKLQ